MCNSKSFVSFSLAVIESDAENDYIRKRMNGDKWIGITDKAKEGQYLTVHGDNMPWAKWSFGEPNGCCGGIQTVQF